MIDEVNENRGLLRATSVDYVEQRPHLSMRYDVLSTATCMIATELHPRCLSLLAQLNRSNRNICAYAFKARNVSRTGVTAY